jgi:hypothetical protein
MIVQVYGGKGTIHGQTCRRWICTTIQDRKVNLHHNTTENRNIEIGFLKHGFRVREPWRLKKMYKVSGLSFHAGIAGHTLLGPYFIYFIPPCLTGAVYQDFLWNLLPKLLKDVDLQTVLHLRLMQNGALPHFLLAVRKFLEQRISGSMDGTSWANNMVCSFPWFIFLQFISGCI